MRLRRTGAVAPMQAKHADSPARPLRLYCRRPRAARRSGGCGVRELESLKAVDWDALKPVQCAVFCGLLAPPKDGPRILVTIKHIAKLGDEYGFTADAATCAASSWSSRSTSGTTRRSKPRCNASRRPARVKSSPLCVGDSDADASLLKALAKGAHRAVRIWDPSLSNTDPITIARAIAGVARSKSPISYSAACNRAIMHTVPPARRLARILGLPHAAVVIGLEWDGQKSLKVTRELEGGLRHNFELQAPAVSRLCRPV